ncbi:MAG: hypothetical protein KBD64_07040, partial [Gammaproteobacteria bacterium]|nr:hypothetical protein [Gammaproteobacteria bacterium]
FNGILCLTVIAVPLITLIVIKTIYAWEEKKKNEGTEKKLKETETENQKLKAELGELQRRMQTLEEAAQSRFNPFADSRSQLPQPLRSSASPKTGEWRRVEPTGTSKGQWQRASEQSKKEEKEESKEEDTASDRSLPPPPPPLYSRTVRVPAKLAKTKPDHIIPLPPLSPPLSPPRVVTADARP